MTNEDTPSYRLTFEAYDYRGGDTQKSCEVTVIAADESTGKERAAHILREVRGVTGSKIWLLIRIEEVASPQSADLEQKKTGTVTAEEAPR